MPPLDLSGLTDASAAIRKHSVRLSGHSTSISLEDAYWTALKALAAADGKPLSRLIGEIDAARTGNLSSALRVHVLRELTARLAA